MQTLTSKRVAIRKPRRCWGCERLHAVGQHMQYCAGVDDGEWWSCYWCEDCIELTERGEDYSQGCFA